MILIPLEITVLICCSRSIPSQRFRGLPNQKNFEMGEKRERERESHLLISSFPSFSPFRWTPNQLSTIQALWASAEQEYERNGRPIEPLSSRFTTRGSHGRRRKPRSDDSASESDYVEESDGNDDDEIDDANNHGRRRGAPRSQRRNKSNNNNNNNNTHDNDDDYDEEDDGAQPYVPEGERHLHHARKASSPARVRKPMAPVSSQPEDPAEDYEVRVM